MILNNVNTYHIHIGGIVQGVGFRPAVYQLAMAQHLLGYVKNDCDGLNIVFNATAAQAKTFFNTIKKNAPAKAKITGARLVKTAPQKFSDFSILVNECDKQDKSVLISPDLAICPDCRAELHDKNNRRYRYPFITCTQCGPRYSVISHLPYERHNTTMQSFTVCSTCKKEYDEVSNRRFFSQTNSCPDCGVRLSLYQAGPALLSENTEEILTQVKELLGQGKIMAIKGTGGYLLLCDAANKKTVQLLRSRKHRPAKPFALLYPGLEAIEKSFVLNDRERQLLQSQEAPIVLLSPKPETRQELASDDIAPGLNRLGVMLPYNPLFELIVTDFGKPLIATSANISGSPIIYRDEDALEYLFDIADFIVSNNRAITVPQDDSVVRVTALSGQTLLLRRSRGYAPSFLDYMPQSNRCVLAAGALLKSTFTLSVNGNVFVSQFLGSGESYESQLMYTQTLGHWLKLYDAAPEVIIADMHPGYFSNRHAREQAGQTNAGLVLVQHHKAHFAAVLAEHGLMLAKEPVLGVIWDGTGLGDDGNIWGGEFFKYEKKAMQRAGHFDYFPVIAGDKMALEPRLSALSLANNVWAGSGLLKDKFSEAEWNTYHSLVADAPIYTSSAGRLFDAVASLLGLCDRQSYEGEAAMYLQKLAEDYVAAHAFEMDSAYFDEHAAEYRVSAASLVQGIMIDMMDGRKSDYIAAKFHYSLTKLVGLVAGQLGIDTICFSGGVFQNALLADWMHHELAGKYRLCFPKNLSPNDEQVSFGQLVYYENGITTLPEACSLKKQRIMEPQLAVDELY